MAYNNPASWGDLSINDDSFLALLQRQIAAANPQSLVLDPTRFPAPPAENITPPLSENSSPSPPSFQDAFGDEKEHYRSGGYDDSSKRKVYDDSDDEEELGQPLHKSQHRAGDTNANKKGNKRKSGGGSNPDESRLLKRKEQNRAAQRAFRERKEKRVKDLEDQVAVLETKTQSQDRENENLRDLLGRLQNENLQLKQSAFSFSFSANGKSPAAASSSQSPPAQRPAASPKLPSPASSSTASTPESTGQTAVYSELFPLATSSTSSISSATTPHSIAPSSQYQLSPTVSFNTLPDFSGIDFSNTSPTTDDTGGSKKRQYTTIASNPMFTSYQDPVLDPMAWASFGPGDSSYLNPSEADMNLFGKSDFGIGAYGMTGQNGFSGGYDELFGGDNSLVGLSDFSGTDFSSPSSSSLGMISMASSPSPVMRANNSLGANSPLFGAHAGSPALSSTATATSTEGCEGKTCPRTAEDVKRHMDKYPQGTFGAPISGGSPPASTRRETDEKDATAHARMASLCSDLPKTVKKPGQIEIGRAWEQMRRHPKFQECDIDELCAELSAKARCDGSRPVIEEESYNELVNALPGVPKK